MPWILLLLISLFSAPSFAVAIPGVTTGTTASQQSTPPPEPDVEQKKAAYGALADVLENDTSRKELIEQLRKAAATPPQETVPTLTPPQEEEQKTVLENVTDVSRHYGEALSSRFAQLYRNLIGSPHKPLCSQFQKSNRLHALRSSMIATQTVRMRATLRDTDIQPFTRFCSSG